LKTIIIGCRTIIGFGRSNIDWKISWIGFRMSRIYMLPDDHRGCRTGRRGLGTNRTGCSTSRIGWNTSKIG